MPGPASYDIAILAHQPNSIRHYRTHAQIVGAFRRVLPYAWQDPCPEPVGGHYAVTRSLVAGLRRIGANFVFTPQLRKTKARTAIVLAGVAELKSAIAWRRQNGCEILLAGPNVVEVPRDADGILLSPEIDGVIVASDKVRGQYEREAPQLTGRVHVWPAGVDENYWMPSGRPRDSILIYNKRLPGLSEKVGTLLRQSGYRCVMIAYGDHRRDKYRPREFRAALDRAYLCVILSLNESQGLAAAEAWSMDVPTFAYRAPGMEAPIPYLAAATGRYWLSTDELLAKVADFPAQHYTPRSWLLENMTDIVCAQKFLMLQQSITGVSR